MVSILDVALLSICTFFGNIGVAVTGFGMAIVYLFIWQICVLCGFVSDMKFAVFIQAIALMCAQPMLLWKAKMREHCTRELLQLFLPITVIATPLGQIAGAKASTDNVKVIGGVIVTAMAMFEIYRNRKLITEALSSSSESTVKAKDEENAANQTQMTATEMQTENPIAQTLDTKQASNRKKKSANFDPRAPVYFMIGSQRSGSNWMRTMLNEREDLAGPHPPHILRDVMPILDKFGDLSKVENLEVMIDHVCTFVERNQVMWTNKHGEPLLFNREHVLKRVQSKIEDLSDYLVDGDDNDETDADETVISPVGTDVPSKAITSPDYLIALFDEIMNTYAIENDKRTWICKSMGNSQFHDQLLRHYGEDRLRYVYLVRDPRDVAMSFMNTPVGDCHWHAVITKWARLQRTAMKVMQATPDIVHQVRYEDLLQHKDDVMELLFEFVGDQRFGKVMRRGSVQELLATKEMLKNAKTGGEAAKAAVLSSQFKNLVRGESFAPSQLQKWRNGPKPLTRDELLLIENVAWEVMEQLGYKPHIVGQNGVVPAVYTLDELAEFKRLNDEGIKKMNEDLEVENPEDAARRKYQAAVLNLPPTKIAHGNMGDVVATAAFVDDGMHTDAQRTYPHNWPVGSKTVGYLSEADITSRLFTTLSRVLDLEDGYKLRWAAASQRGYYPMKPTKPNQDALATHERVGGKRGLAWFGVYDGHGPAGDKCAQFAGGKLLSNFEDALTTQSGDIAGALEEAHLKTNKELSHAADIDDTKSGTTAITVCVDGRQCIVSNVGDSRCMIASIDSNGKLVVNVLSSDQTPLRRDECERVQACGARVMTTGQIEGTEPFHENWDGDDPPRVWASDGKYPGTAFTRSIGDSTAESLGVYAKPEFASYTIGEKDVAIIVASDGITEFISNNECFEAALLYPNDPREACNALVGESYARWIKSEDRTDDITVIVAFVDKPGSAAVPPPDHEGKAQAKTFGFKLWALSMGFASGFFGGLCGIRGPPIIMFFLHSPYPKAVQRANGAAITLVNVSMRILFYIAESSTQRPLEIDDDVETFDGNDWPLYVCIAISSVTAVHVGTELFNRLKDSQATIKTILACMLLLCGVSLLITAIA